MESHKEQSSGNQIARVSLPTHNAWLCVARWSSLGSGVLQITHIGPISVGSTRPYGMHI